MSKDGYLPDDVNESDIPGNRPGDEHATACPCHEDAPQLCLCGCDMEGHPKDRCDSELGRSSKCGCERRKLQELDCICAEIEEEIREAKAEARAEARREARYD